MDRSASGEVGAVSCAPNPRGSAAPELRPYQRQALNDARDHFRTGARSVVIVAPTGAGKSVLFAEIAAQHIAKGGRVLVVAHRRELVKQAAGHLARRGIIARTIVGGRALGPVAAEATVAAVQSLTAKAWRDRLPPATLVIWDECFPAGTLVDGKPIESLTAGDRVFSYNHDAHHIESRRIVRTFKSVPTSMVRVHLDDGRSIACTAGHPFYTRGEYVPAAHLKEGDALHGHVSHVREACGPVDKGQAGPLQGDGARVLLAGMHVGVSEGTLVGDDGEDEPARRVGSDDGTQPDAQPGDAGEGVGDTASDRSRSEHARRERQGAECAAASTCDRARLADGVRGGNGQGRAVCGAVDALQDRRGGPDHEDGDRDRRRQSLRGEGAGAGREENALPRVARVACVEVLERGCDGTFGGVLPDGYVYNVEVEANHNYFVDGVLVHNCHHIKAPSFLTVQQAYASAHHVGLTATPERADRSPLGDVFDRMVVVATVRELTDDGFLVPCEVWAPPQSKTQLAADAADAYLEHGENKRAIVFCANVTHAKEVADKLRAASVSAEYVDGTMPTRERDEALARFASGQTQVITNCSLISEGFDVPACKCVVIARGCDSVAMYLQAVGRALRPESSGESALVLDLRGAVHKHGMPDADRAYSLDGEAISGGDKVQPVKQCKKCGAVFKPAIVCPRCGASAPLPVSPEVRRETLQRISEAHTEDQRRDYWNRLKAEAKARGFKPGWAFFRFKARYGVPPRFSGGEVA